MSDNIYVLQRLTGFDRTDLANLLNVDKPAIHNWATGEKFGKANRKHLAETLAVVRYSDRRFPEENAAALAKRSLTDETPIEAIKTHRYPIARQYMGRGRSRL